MSNLLWSHPFGIEYRIDRVLPPSCQVECTGKLELVPDSAFDRKFGSVQCGAELKCDLNVSQFHGGIHSVDRNVGRTESSPQMVPVPAQALCRPIGF